MNRLSSDSSIKLKAEQYVNQRLHQEAVNRERIYFTKTSKTVNPKQENPFIYLPGQTSLLILAPYAVRYKQKKKTMVSHEFTGGTALLLNELINCHVLTVTKLYGGDPMNDLPCIYKERIEDIIKKQKIKQVVTLVAGNRDKDSLLEIQGTGKLVQQLNSPLTKHIETQVGFIDSADKEEWLPLYIAKRVGTASTVVRINRKARVPHQNGHVFCNMLAILVQFLNDNRNSCT